MAIMDNLHGLTMLSLIFFFCFAFADERKVYIAYMGILPENDYSPVDHHRSILQEVLESSFPPDALIRSFKRSFNGFAANLTETERRKLESRKDIISVFPSRKCKLLTTRSWNFMGITDDVKRVPTVESDIIIGVIDSGIWPESDSFNDKGFGPPPKKWKGTCNGGKNFSCNNKLIGARYYGGSSARDTTGHGSHVASIAAGSLVKNASFYGLAEGNAKGGVPSARIAVYRVCGYQSGCAYEDIFAAFDDAISDGVDFISVSLGTPVVLDYSVDPIAIGSFHALRKGILTSQAAGNLVDGFLGGLVSLAPWVLSVGASSIDRKFVSKVVLGDNTTLAGRAINGFENTDEIALTSKIEDGIRLDSCCAGKNSNISSKHGTIFFYNYFSDGKEALAENATGVIATSDRNPGFTQLYPLPATLLYTADAEKIKSYINKEQKPVARILKSETLHDSSEPVVALFSGRGPNPLSRDILKPDLVAPGSDIIAAWSPLASPSHVKGNKMSVKYSILSGTSMACPHVTSAAAYVKTFHPDWSPSAIKSSLMTTAYPLNATTNPDAELAYGSGHIDPIRAVNPGLVYEVDEKDYILYLCGALTPEEVGKISGDRNVTCPKNKLPAKDLNYPSMTSFSGDANFTRTVTNVGLANSTYQATIQAPANLEVSVSPMVLSFKSLNERKSFVVTVSLKPVPSRNISSASLVWSDGIHSVRSPIFVRDIYFQ